MPILWSNFITHNFKNKQKRLSDVGNEQKRQGNEETGESRVLLVGKLSMPEPRTVIQETSSKMQHEMSPFFFFMLRGFRPLADFYE